MKTILRLTVLFALLAEVCFGQGAGSGLAVQVQNAGTPVVTAKKWLVLNCVSGLNCAYSNGVLGITVTGGSTAFSSITAGSSADTGAFGSAGTWTFSGAGAASVSPVTLTGANFVGTGTTSTPLFYINQGTAPTTWSTGTGGTLLGLNAVTGFAGNFADFHLNGGAQLFGVSSNGSVTSAGSLQVGSANSMKWASRSVMNSGSDGVIQLTNAAGTSFTRLQLGLTTSSGPAFGVSGTTITAQLGDGTAGGTFSASNYATVTNCAAAGTAANPSVASCTAAPSGSFSCATNASTGTCTVNTTAVTANSRIFVMPSAAEGANLSVTCNTTADTGLTAPRLASKSAGTSFTINLGTFSTNPECFNYWIVN